MVTILADPSTVSLSHLVAIGAVTDRFENFDDVAVGQMSVRLADERIDYCI